MNDQNTPETTQPTTEPTQPPAPVEKPKQRRGFAAMDPAKVKEIASKGGKSAHLAGTAHQFSSEEAKLAGKKGGMAPHVSRGTQKKAPTQ